MKGVRTVKHGCGPGPPIGVGLEGGRAVLENYKILGRILKKDFNRCRSG